MIRPILKQATARFHVALESRLSVLLDDDISLDQYAAVQKKFYGFYRPIEARLSSILGRDDPELRLASRLKLPSLISDLASLDVDADGLTGLPSCDALPRLETLPEALGCLYVLEGSTLGGRVIAGHLKKILPIDEDRGCSFFHSYGDDVGRMWSSFLGILERHCREHGDSEVVVRSACQTFSCLDRWFSDAS